MATPLSKMTLAEKLARLDELLTQSMRKSKGTAQEKKQKIRIVPWMEENLKVAPDYGGLIPFKHRPVQLEIANFIQTCLDADRPAWFVCLKSRRHGVSTEMQGVRECFSCHDNNAKYLTVAHCEPSAKTIFEIGRTFYRELPDSIRPPLEGGKKQSKQHITLAAPWNNKSEVLTAGGAEIRGAGYKIIHASELAFWSDAGPQMGALNKCIAKRPNFSIFCIESTPNGLGEFKYYWDLANNPQSNWHPFFFPHFADKECRAEPPLNFELTYDEQEYKALILKEAGVELDDWQMTWVRRTIEDQCGGRWEEFHREYPGTPTLAFSGQAHFVFDQHIVSRQVELITPQFSSDGTKEEPKVKPIFVGDIWFDEEIPSRPALLEKPNGPLRIYEEYRSGEDYTLGADTGLGKGLDDSAAVVLAKNPLRIVAVYQSNTIAPMQYGVKIYLFGLQYDAFVVPETNIGDSVISVLAHGLVGVSLPPMLMEKLNALPAQQRWKVLRYPKLYSEKRFNREGLPEQEELGLRTTGKNRTRMISDLSEIFNAGMLTVPDLAVLQQFQGFVLEPKLIFAKSGRATQQTVFTQTWREPGQRVAKDDLIFATALAYHVMFANPAQDQSVGNNVRVEG